MYSDDLGYITCDINFTYITSNVTILRTKLYNLSEK